MKRLSALIFFLPLALGSCDGIGSGPRMTDLTMWLAPASAPGTSALIQLQGPISLDLISEISVTVTGVQARLESPGDVEGAWFDLAVDGGSKTINLVDLPSAGLVLANGSVPSGDYTDARLFFDSETVTITLGAEACFGAAGDAAQLAQVCLAPGTYDLRVPSGEETGVKTGGHFTLEEGAASVGLEFDADATVRTLTWLPDLEVVVMNPVIRAANEAGE